MQLVLIAAVVLAVAVGLVFFMGKKQKALMKKPSQQPMQQQSTPTQSQSSTSPQQPRNPAQ